MLQSACESAVRQQSEPAACLSDTTWTRHRQLLAGYDNDTCIGGHHRTWNCRGHATLDLSESNGTHAVSAGM